MLLSITHPGRLLALLLVAHGALAQTTTGIVVMPTPLDWDNAYARCRELGYGMYPVPASPTDAVYDFVKNEPGDRFWITRRRGGSCTFMFKEPGGDLVAEAPCGEPLPAVCKMCSGDPWCP
ncbi:hypothetical protein MMYC01_204480 [Madurella mycetomatis]|uniref:C-type lectin domain-containing protein n=1 Tax=Madurella mycetomatis TaxID=100816 RepID=A0A175W4X5_9PEZI|nr:hypothetical protein MMYC01_205303 [Madurella mycetomatis]KXX79563.1 hypothetical protein MMYC01_204480 [Madurella mycetomatis]